MKGVVLLDSSTAKIRFRTAIDVGSATESVGEGMSASWVSAALIAGDIDPY